MKRSLVITFMAGFLLVDSASMYADDTATNGDVAVVAPVSDAADGLDLRAVGGLFKDSKDLEEFEKSLNDPETGINNLDLDENGEVDYVRVVEEVADDTRVIILQATLAEDEFQDVATIEIEKTDDGSHNMQVRGNVLIYGPDYYVVPTYTRIHTWPIVVWMYHPTHHPYRSVYHFGHHPHWWRPYHPVHVSAYHVRTARYTRSASFTVTRTSRVRTVSKVNYRARTSTRVTRTTRARTTTKSTAGARKNKAQTKSVEVTRSKQAAKKSGKRSSVKGAKNNAKKGGKGKTGARKTAGKKKKSGAKGVKKKGSRKGRKKGGKRGGKKGGKP